MRGRISTSVLWKIEKIKIRVDQCLPSPTSRSRPCTSGSWGSGSRGGRRGARRGWSRTLSVLRSHQRLIPSFSLKTFRNIIHTPWRLWSINNTVVRTYFYIYQHKILKFLHFQSSKRLSFGNEFGFSAKWRSCFRKIIQFPKLSSNVTVKLLSNHLFQSLLIWCEPPVWARISRDRGESKIYREWHKLGVPSFSQSSSCLEPVLEFCCSFQRLFLLQWH